MLKRILFLLFFAFKLNAQELPVNTLDIGNSIDQDTVSAEAPITKHRRADKVYHVNYKTVLPFVAVSYGAVYYSFSVIYKKPNTPDATVLALNENDIPSFDRWATKYHDENLDKISYYPFYAVMPLPAILFIDKRMRKDAGQIGAIYLEAFAFTGLLYGGSVYFVDRYRPDVYNTSLPMSYRHNGNYRNSFFAGHVAVVATSTFFIARVYDDYYPDSKWKWALYGGATVATLGMGYIRLEAGKHFPSDILLGAVVGTASGLLTPIFHKNKDYNKQKWSLSPGFMEQGPTLAFTYRL